MITTIVISNLRYGGEKSQATINRTDLSYIGMTSKKIDLGDVFSCQCTFFMQSYKEFKT